jgi:cytosine/adenosine deaminase-related metal-dependent hydrolase
MSSVATSWAKTTEESLAKGLALYEKFKDHPLIYGALAPHAPYTVDDETFSKIVQYMKGTLKLLLCTNTESVSSTLLTRLTFI